MNRQHIFASDGSAYELISADLHVFGDASPVCVSIECRSHARESDPFIGRAEEIAALPRRWVKPAFVGLSVAAPVVLAAQMIRSGPGQGRQR